MYWHYWIWIGEDKIGFIIVAIFKGKGIITNNNEHTDDVHRFGLGNMLMLVRTAHCFGVLVHLPDMASEELTVWYMFFMMGEHIYKIV